MNRSLALLSIGVFGLWTGTAVAQQPQEPLKPAITVTISGKETAKADLAIVFLSVRSTAPLAADALDQNNKKVQEVKARLTALGYKEDKVKFSGNRFAPAGQGMFFGGQRPTGFDVYNNIYVYLEGPDLNDVNQFNARVGTLLDELGRLGASPSMLAISAVSMGGSSVVAFTVKDPAPYEKKAYLQALEKARPIAEDIARRMKVQITGIDSVSSSTSSRAATFGPFVPASPLDEIPYEYVSSSMDEVPIRVKLDVRFSYK